MQSEQQRESRLKKTYRFTEARRKGHRNSDTSQLKFGELRTKTKPNQTQIKQKSFESSQREATSNT
jgi:hypothetical protein